MFELDDVVEYKDGRLATIVPIPSDYSFHSKDDPLKMARLVYVRFCDKDGQEDVVLVPESRLKFVTKKLKVDKDT